jgi:CubicO group peptidase (beta-lactamase class C family)
MLHAAAVVLIAMFGASPSHAQAGDSLTAAVATALAEEGLTGATWSLVTPAGITVGAAGSRELPRRIPMRPTDRVQVGSVAKTLVATGVLVLVTQGRVELDAPIERYLPGLPIGNAWSSVAPLRVRHLLDHTSGLHDARLWQVFTLRGDPDAPLRAGLAREGETLRLRSRPGARPSYSNSGYLVAAMLIEEVTGMRYERWLARELLAPLGMARSTFEFVSQVGPAADSTMAMGHFDGVTPHPSYAIPVRPASQFATTAADMALFARFLMSDGSIGGRRLVDSVLLRGMARPVGTEAARAGLTAGLALGLATRERWGVPGNCHAGNIGTFRALLCLYPEQQRAFFVSYNTDPEAANFDRVDSLLAAALVLRPKDAAAVQAPSEDVEAWNGWYVVRPNRFPQFTYLDELAGITRVSWDGSVLMLRPMQGTDRVLHPVGGRLFRLDGRRNATHVLTRSPEGAALLADGFRTMERVSRWRVILLWSSAVAGMLGLAYLLVVGSVRTVRAWRGGTSGEEPLRWTALVGALMLLAPALLLTQPFLAIGDPTPANLTLAALTGALPLALLASLVERVRRGLRSRSAVGDVVALGSALQWCAVLGAWGMLPLMLWR